MTTTYESIERNLPIAIAFTSIRTGRPITLTLTVDIEADTIETVTPATYEDTAEVERTVTITNADAIIATIEDAAKSANAYPARAAQWNLEMILEELEIVIDDDIIAANRFVRCA